MERARWLDTSTAVLNELLGLLLPQERDAAFEELVAKVRARRAKSRSAVLEPVRVATPTPPALKGPNPVCIPREEAE